MVERILNSQDIETTRIIVRNGWDCSVQTAYDFTNDGAHGGVVRVTIDNKELALKKYSPDNVARLSFF